MLLLLVIVVLRHNKMAKCKICTHPKRSEIEALRVNNKLGYEKIAQYCKTVLGLEVSHMTVKRHFDSHLEGYSIEDRIEPQMDVNKVRDALLGGNIIASQCNTTEDIKALAKQELPQMIANQIEIVKDKQAKYMSQQGGQISNNDLTILVKLLETLEKL